MGRPRMMLRIQGDEEGMMVTLNPRKMHNRSIRFPCEPLLVHRAISRRTRRLPSFQVNLEPTAPRSIRLVHDIKLVNDRQPGTALLKPPFLSFGARVVLKSPVKSHSLSTGIRKLIKPSHNLSRTLAEGLPYTAVRRKELLSSSSTTSMCTNCLWLTNTSIFTLSLHKIQIPPENLTASILWE